MTTELAADKIVQVSGRQDWLDCTRGLGILFVVVAHTWRGLIDSDIMQWTATMRVIDTTVYSFHMPLFFFLAGITGASALTKEKFVSIRSKIRSVAYPYLLWSFIVGGLLLVTGKNAHTSFTWADMVAIPWHPIQQFWFLQTLFAIQILTLLVSRRRTIFLVALGGFIISSSLLSHDRLLFNWLHFLIFFAAGVHFSSYKSSVLTKNSALAAILFALAIVIGIATRQHYTGWAFLPAAAVGIFLMMQCGTTLASSSYAFAFRLLGQRSMTIYVAHILVASGLRVVMVKLGVPLVPALYLTLCAGAGVLLPLAFHSVLQKLDMLWLFGLGRREKKVK
jgi:fucose 4-O-acetylase-like acetyltransferase